MYGFDKNIGTADDLAFMKYGKKYGKGANRNVHIMEHLISYAEEIKMPSETLKRMIEKATSKPQGEPVKAIINNNRLIAYCDMCGGAEAINFDGSFYCLTCYNVGNDGKPRPITYPRGLKNIVELLEKRPKFLQRNYLGESLTELKKENRSIGV